MADEKREPTVDTEKVWRENGEGAPRSGPYRLEPGYAFNPLKAHRNIKCPCGSQRKAKRCHGVYEALPIEVAEKVKRYLAAKKAYEAGR